MKKILLLLLLLLITSGCVIKSEPKNFDRYKIHSSNGLTILYDTTTGCTWRNVNCNKDGIPNCWQSMEFVYGDNKYDCGVPAGVKLFYSDEYYEK